jgi:hypothetical protein
MFAYYIHCECDLPTLNYEPVYEEQASDLHLDKNGIYSYFISHSAELHHFILVVNNEEVTLLSTYGGQKKIINITYNKTKFIDAFHHLQIKDDTNKIKAYCNLFGIKTVHFDTLDMSDIILKYTFREFPPPPPHSLYHIGTVSPDEIHLS